MSKRKRKKFVQTEMSDYLRTREDAEPDEPNCRHCMRPCDEPAALDHEGFRICRIHLREQNFGKCSDCGAAFESTDHALDVHVHPMRGCETLAVCVDCMIESGYSAAESPQ